MAKAAPSWGEVLSAKSTQTGMVLFLLQQLSGINAIVYFSSAVFQVRGEGWVTSARNGTIS